MFEVVVFLLGILSIVMDEYWRRRYRRKMSDPEYFEKRHAREKRDAKYIKFFFLLLGVVNILYPIFVYAGIFYNPRTDLCPPVIVAGIMCIMIAAFYDKFLASKFKRDESMRNKDKS